MHNGFTVRVHDVFCCCKLRSHTFFRNAYSRWLHSTWQFLFLFSLRNAFVSAFLFINHAAAPHLCPGKLHFSKTTAAPFKNLLLYSCVSGKKSERARNDSSPYEYFYLCVTRWIFLNMVNSSTGCDYKFRRTYIKVCQTITNSVAKTNQSCLRF